MRLFRAWMKADDEIIVKAITEDSGEVQPLWGRMVSRHDSVFLFETIEELSVNSVIRFRIGALEEELEVLHSEQPNRISTYEIERIEVFDSEFDEISVPDYESTIDLFEYTPDTEGEEIGREEESYMKGFIDEIEVYDEYLETDEIMKHFEEKQSNLETTNLSL